ncbi:MAG: protein kinase [Bacteroidetes bacterium]|nr:MAG: protein kinase [Bacteroidota bacterium]
MEDTDLTMMFQLGKSCNILYILYTMFCIGLNIARRLTVPLMLLLAAGCSGPDDRTERSREGAADTLQWYRQASVDLGTRIVMFSDSDGIAVSRGRGREFSGKLYRFRGGQWQPLHHFPYSDFPLIASRDSMHGISLVTHRTHDGAYRPVFTSFSPAGRRDVPLPVIMWDAVDHVMMKGIHQFADGKGWMVGQQGHILHNDGRSWKEVASPLLTDDRVNAYDGDLNDICMLDDGNGWAVGRGGVILRYRNGRWERTPSPTQKSLFRVRFADAGNGWAVGERGTVIRWNGREWSEEESGTRETLNSLKVIGADEVWAVGNASTLLKRTGGVWRTEPSILVYDDVLSDIDVIANGGARDLWIIGGLGIYTTANSTGFSFTDVTGPSSLRRHGRGALFLDEGTDERPGLFLFNEGSSNLLYESDGSAVFTDVTVQRGLSGAPRDPSAVAAGDVDNDGRTDLLQIADHRLFTLHRGTLTGGFEDMTERSGLALREMNASGLNAARFVDLDGDGALDLYISNYDLPDQLFRNDGTGRFTDVTDDAGISKHTGHASYGAAFADVNGDGRTDILLPYYVSYKGSFFDLFLNAGGWTFRRASQPLYIAENDIAPTIAVPGDFNNDGAADFAVHCQKAPPLLFINDGNGRFTEQGARSGLTETIFHAEPSNGMMAAADVNNDGRLDLFIGSKLYLNSAGMRFTEVSERVGLQFAGNPSFADIDGDGDLDLFIGSARASLGTGDRAVLYRNNLDPEEARVLRLEPDRGNRSGTGITVTAGPWNATVGEGASPMIPNSSRRVILPESVGKEEPVRIRFKSGDTILPVPSSTLVRESGAYLHWLILSGLSVRRAAAMLDWRIESAKALLTAAALLLFFLLAAPAGLRRQATASVTIGLSAAVHLLLVYALSGTAPAANIVLSFLVTSGTGIAAAWGRHVRDERRRAQHIGRYRLGELIGQGGMGKVYRAADTVTKRPAAVKVLNPELMNDPENRRRLAAEGHLLASFDHPNIVTVYETGESEGRGYIAMEFLGGGTLRERLAQRHPLPLPEVREIVRQVCGGLTAVHAAGIVHRDLKTGNLMFGDDGRVRIMDFGLSKSPLVTTMTSLGTVLGTLGYVAPEQVTSTDVDARTDIFSLGVILYELLTNTLPFKGENEIALIHSIFNTVPPPPSTLRPEVPPAWDAAAARCLAKDAASRFATAAELADALASM